MKDFKTVRSRRRTIALQITHEGTLLVRAPYRVPQTYINELVMEKKSWIEQKIAIVRKRYEAAKQFKQIPKEAVSEYKKEALERIKQRVELYSLQMGLQYKSVKISTAKYRWGSCSTKGMLNFNWRIVLVPQTVMDYIVVHELSHLAHADHSESFWAKVKLYFPEYRKAKDWLKQNQHLLML